MNYNIKPLSEEFLGRLSYEEKIAYNRILDIINKIIKKRPESQEELLKNFALKKSNPYVLFAIANVMYELSKRQKLEISEENITYLGSGRFSNVIKVGEYVMKIGKDRFSPIVPKHRRIIQPLLRTNISENIFVEVQNLTDNNWWKNKSDREIKFIINKIQRELNENGIGWIDAAAKNIGVLIKPNKANFPTCILQKDGKEIQTDFVSNSSIGFITEKDEQIGKVLRAGSYVIIDTDGIFQIRRRN